MTRRTNSRNCISFLSRFRKAREPLNVHEYAKPNAMNMLFYAEADKQTNQKTAPFSPCGWGPTLLVALSECVKNIRRFPYEDV